MYPVQVLFREYFEGILAAVFLALFLRFFVVNILYIPTDSMEPALKRGDFVIGWRLTYGFPLPLMKGERLNAKSPDRGDLISFRFPGDEEQLIVRRVVAVAGDRVEIVEGQLKVNGKVIPHEPNSDGSFQENLNEGDPNYSILPKKSDSLSLVEVPEGHVFVLSDNRSRMDDSRDWGFVPEKNIESRLGLIWLSVNNQSGGFEILWPRLFTQVR